MAKFENAECVTIGPLCPKQHKEYGVCFGRVFVYSRMTPLTLPLTAYCWASQIQTDKKSDA